MPRPFRVRLVACLALLCLPSIVLAQGLPKPKEFYFDDDAQVAKPIVVIEGSDDATVERLLKLTQQRGGRNARSSDRSERAEAQIAHIAYVDGEPATGDGIYRRLQASAGTGAFRQSLLWNHGWDLYRSGSVEQALQQWAGSLEGRLTNPSWAPPTFALGLWKLGRRDEAVRWYAAAVRTEPGRWNDARNLPALLPGWGDADRKLLAEVVAAWAANPPAWP